MSARPKVPGELRRRAERRLEELSARDRALEGADARRLLHELQVHQVELELQNEELQGSRIEMEDLLRRYTELFDFAPVGFFRVGQGGRIDAANFAGARLLGLPRGAIVGRALGSFVAMRERGAFDRLLGSVLVQAEADAPSEKAEFTLLRGGQGEVLVRATFASLRDGPAPSALVALEDVTARRQAEEALHEESHRKDEFLAALSHELRNPLSPIRNALALLQRVPPGSEKAATAVGIIDRQVSYLTHIVDDLLDVTRIARGKILLQTERRRLGELVCSTVEDHRTAFEAKGVRLRCEATATPIWADVDPARLAQVIGNLLGNALKFTNPGDLVEVELEAQDDVAVLRVRDTGVGIAPELMQHLFEPFSQGAQTLERSRGGLGLGLATVKGLVELHRGKVEVRSAGTGQGAEFLVRLPCVPQAPVTDGGSPVGGRAAPRRVLLIEDNRDAAESLKELLELRGHLVHVASDGRSGISEARSFRPDVVLCDIGLPGVSGYDVARALRPDGRPGSPMLVALSGYASSEDVRRAQEAGFDRHLSKPTSYESIDTLLAEAPTHVA